MPFNVNPFLAEGKPRVEFKVSQNILSRWQPAIKAEANDSDVIEIYDEIGFDWWSGTGITSKSISQQLRGKGDVTVNINSPGGDLFEGLAIYNLLTQHPGKVKVNVIGIAASAASIIAMAGDERHISKASFLMIHNCWCCACGNRLDFIEYAETMSNFDRAMAGVYEDATGGDISEIEEMMNAETWLDAQSAVELGFATQITETKTIEARADAQPLIKALDTLLAKEGMPRSQRRQLFNQIKNGTPNAAKSDTPNAVTQSSIDDLKKALSNLSKTLEGK